jgi:hypothetical protein
MARPNTPAAFPTEGQQIVSLVTMKLTHYPFPSFRFVGNWPARGALSLNSTRFGVPRGNAVADGTKWTAKRARGYREGKAPTFALPYTWASFSQSSY